MQVIIHLVHVFLSPIPCYVTRILVDWIVQQREQSMNITHRARGQHTLWGVCALSLLLGLDPAECHGIIIMHLNGYRIVLYCNYISTSEETATSRSFILFVTSEKEQNLAVKL